MLTNEDIINFCNSKNYDIRISGSGRWIDQKCTPDVLWSISDYVLNYVDNVNNTFTVSDIWQSDYAKETVAETYSKPGTDEESAENEYDKFFSQNLCLLDYAGVIEDISTTRQHLYKVANRDVLEFIARNDNFSLRFLQIYIEQVLSDSGLFGLFEEFFHSPTKSGFNSLKMEIIKFYHDYTPIKRDYEPKRIFTKIINPLALKYHSYGTEKGRMSRNIIVRSDLMYNRDNFRDIYDEKPKGVTRKEWLLLHPNYHINNGYFEQCLNRVKPILRANIESRNYVSELTQFDTTFSDMDRASQLHHIFPKNEFPEIMHYLENLIALTPNQHFNFAHPNNNTQVIDLDAQRHLLICKTASIKYNLENEENIYDFENLLKVLQVGFDDDKALDIAENDFIDVLHFINYHY